VSQLQRFDGVLFLTESSQCVVFLDDKCEIEDISEIQNNDVLYVLGVKEEVSRAQRKKRKKKEKKKKKIQKKA
jgi:uncharacterized protein YerC